MIKITHKNMIGYEIRTLDNLLMRRMVADSAKYGIDEATILHGWIIGYLYDNQDREIFQKDVETEFSLARSSVTCIVKLMEKKGYITRESVSYDARLKKLCLTQKGEELNQRTRCNIDKLENELCDRLTQEELQQFLTISRKLKSSLTEEFA